MLSLIVAILSGCSHTVNKILSPPADTKWVNVEIKNPSQYTEPLSLLVRYISYECPKKRVSGFDGSVITEPSYNPIRIPMQQQSGDIWRAKVPMTGGGSCKWALSAVKLSIHYIDTTHLGKDLVSGTAVGAIIAFDNDASQNGQFDIVSSNNTTFSPVFYPLIKIDKRNGEYDELSLFGKDDFLQKKIIGISDSITIMFNPILDESKIVKRIAPSEYKVGVFPKIVYPDGTILSGGAIRPDIRMVK